MGVPKCCGQTTCTEDMPLKKDKRCQLINEVKELIGDIEHGEKMKPRGSRRPDRPGVPGMRDMEEECTRWRKRRDCTPPLITKIALHEIRPTSDYTNMRLENSSQVTYVDVTNEGKEFRKVPPAPWDLPRKPSQELRSGELYLNCRCLKRDGLQYDCPRWECAGRPECVAVNPGPCCVPSQWPKPIRGDKRYGGKLAQGEGAISYEGRQLKTGPLNPEICEPMGAQQQFGGRDGQQGEVLGFMVGGHQHQISDQHQNSHQHQYQNVRGNIPQATPPTDVIMVLDLGQINPGVQNRQVQTQEFSQATMLQGPGVTCCCRPA